MGVFVLKLGNGVPYLTRDSSRGEHETRLFFPLLVSNYLIHRFNLHLFVPHLFPKLNVPEVAYDKYR